MNKRGQLSSASSLTNLNSEQDYPPQRARSASELLEHGTVLGPARFRSRQRSRDIRSSLADSRSDYYNNRRPQSISLSSQIPAHSALHSASSISALGTISETNANRFSSNVLFSTDDSIFAETPDTPLFHYNPALSFSELTTPTRAGSVRQFNTQALGTRPHELNGTNRNGVHHPPTDSSLSKMVHVSEPITREFVPFFMNPVTGQMYTHSDDYFKPIASTDELLVEPPKPDKRQEETTKEHAPSHITFTQILAILFFVCGNFIVLAVCSLPALFCAQKVHQMNLQKKYKKARKHSEYVLCFNILGIVLHVVVMVAAIVTAVVLAITYT